MSTQQIKVYSKYLKKEMTTYIYVPDEYANISLPVLYFFHGRTGNGEILTQLGMDTLAQDLISSNQILPMIIVCPSIDNSRGLNSSINYKELNGKNGIVHKGQYENYFINEIIPIIDKKYNTISNRNSRYIGGISAGGYAALHIAFRHQNLFSKVGGHMPAIDLHFEDEDECYFKNKEMWIKYDPITIATNNNIKDIKVFLDAGNEDEGQFYIACKELTRILNFKNVKVENHIFSGHHNANYIISNLKQYLKFYSTK